MTAGSAATAWALLRPEGRLFDPPKQFTVDDRGLPHLDDPDHRVSAALETVVEWNTRNRTLVPAQPGLAPSNPRIKDGRSTLHFDDPQSGAISG